MSTTIGTIDHSVPTPLCDQIAAGVRRGLACGELQSAERCDRATDHRLSDGRRP